VVFGFVAAADGHNEVTTVPAADVYGCAHVIARVFTGLGSGDRDWTLFATDRPVAGRTPFTVRDQGQVANGAALQMLGYPLGLPLKHTPNGHVQSNDPAAFRFYSNLDAFAGNSGSPVLNASGVVEGILVTGPGFDFLPTPNGSGGTCAAVKICDETGGCPGFGGVMRITAAMQGRSCQNGSKDGLETDVDCGGTFCGSCALGKSCLVESDCASVHCQHGLCAAPTCNDGAKNGDEVDIDCGGSCHPCGDGAQCVAQADCASQLCFGHRCLSACTDGRQDGTETDVDCGGGTRASGNWTSVCGACAVGKTCIADVDCASGACAKGKCAPATCLDGVRNAGETDIDCGGPCKVCSIGGRCFVAGDCVSSLCFGGRCMSLCSDGVMNGSETGVDCGGATRAAPPYMEACAACAQGVGCVADADCAAGVCSGGKCGPATCRDHVKNAGETDVDCGGPCGVCPEGGRCFVGRDCGTSTCFGGRCMSLCSDNVTNGPETALDCGGGTRASGLYEDACAPCPLGLACTGNEDCSSHLCLAGTCRAP
jgi:hypothetical protein